MGFYPSIHLTIARRGVEIYLIYLFYKFSFGDSGVLLTNWQENLLNIGRKFVYYHVYERFTIMNLILYSLFVMIAIVVVTITYAVVLVFRLRKLSKKNEQVERAFNQKQSDLNKVSQQLKKTDNKVGSLEAALELLQLHYDVLFNHSHYMLFTFGLTENGMPDYIIEVNDVACSLLGRSREDLLKMTILDIEDIEKPTTMVRLFHRNELVMLSDAEIEYRQTTSDRQLIKQILNNAAVHYERIYITGSGNRIPVEVRAQKFEVNGQVRVLCSVHDITERQRNQRAVKEGRQRLRDLLNQSPIGAVLYDAECNMDDVNISCLHMFGTPDAESFLRVNLFDNPFIADDVKDKLSRKEAVRFEAIFDFDEVHQQGLFVSSRNGKVYFDIMLINLGMDSDFKPRGYLFQIQDITERREAELKLRKREDQSRQSQKLEAIGSLASGIAHDFNNILTPVMGYAELVLHSTSQDDALYEYMTEVLQASHRAKDLINQILTFSRKSEQERMSLRMSTVIKEVVKLVSSTAPENIDFTHYLKAASDGVLANPVQMHQVLMNLCVNAMHAMKDDGGALIIRTDNITIEKNSESGLESGKYLRIDVQDGGCGMDAATAERIFDPFFTTKAPGEGTGMGLAVVHGIITGMNGSITVDSALGEGTCFHILLPVVENATDQVVVKMESVPHGSERILVVDNEEAILRMMDHILSGLGYTVKALSDPVEALELLKSNIDDFDLLITDQIMPQMLGSELAEKVLAENPGFPIVISTGFSDKFTPKQATEMGIRGFIMKPIVMRNLAVAIRDALGGEW